MITEKEKIELNESYDFSLNISYSNLNSFESTLIYQSAFLAFLKLEKYIDKKVNTKMNYLYEIMKDYDFIKTTLSELKKNVKYTSMCVDDSYVFLLLFSYDFFQDFYICICELHNTGSISTTTQETFLHNIKLLIE